jgi:hypothetical protein
LEISRCVNSTMWERGSTPINSAREPKREGH